MNTPFLHVPVTASLALGATRSTLAWLPDGPRFDVALGHQHPGVPVWTGEPSAWALENAIQHIEDAIAPWARLSPRRGALALDAASLARLVQAGAAPQAGGHWTVDGVEQAYQRLAARALGGRAAAVPDAAQDATVLILRECLHHGGFEALVSAAD